MQRLGQLLHSMNSVKKFLPESEEVFKRVESSRIELKTSHLK